MCCSPHANVLLHGIHPCETPCEANHSPEGVCVCYTSVCARICKPHKHVFVFVKQMDSKRDRQQIRERERDMKAQFQLWRIASYKLLHLCRVQSCSFKHPRSDSGCQSYSNTTGNKKRKSVHCTLSKVKPQSLFIQIQMFVSRPADFTIIAPGLLHGPLSESSCGLNGCMHQRWHWHKFQCDFLSCFWFHCSRVILGNGR